jgi:hypothetical protein
MRHGGYRVSSAPRLIFQMQHRPILATVLSTNGLRGRGANTYHLYSTSSTICARLLPRANGISFEMLVPFGFSVGKILLNIRTQSPGRKTDVHLGDSVAALTLFKGVGVALKPMVEAPPTTKAPSDTWRLLRQSYCHCKNPRATEVFTAE